LFCLGLDEAPALRIDEAGLAVGKLLLDRLRFAE
jgi:hypothetical protein